MLTQESHELQVNEGAHGASVAAGTTTMSWSHRIVSIFSSVKMTVVTIALIAASVLIGAWCPQESQVGQEKIIQQFGEDMALNLIQWGIADIFHSPWFLTLIGILTLNMVACSCQRVFPKVRSLKTNMPPIGAREIERLPVNHSFAVQTSPIDTVTKTLRRQGYVVRLFDNKIAAEFGKYTRLAATVTHIGLLSLLAGVTITSWTGFSGFKPVRLGDELSFGKSEHSKLWIGKLPTWKVRVDATRREDYPTGEAKQWYSDLTAIDEHGKVLTKQEISVNTPFSYDGVDIYQSSWGLDQLHLNFNGDRRTLQMRPMGKKFAAFLPLDQTTVLIFSLQSQTDPLRIFAKRADWQTPQMLAQLKQGQAIDMGAVHLTYDGVIPVTGLQYKSDPGLPVVFVAFGFIMVGVLMAMIPNRYFWMAVEPRLAEDKDNESGFTVTFGGRSAKAKVGFERAMQKLAETIKSAQELQGIQGIHELHGSPESQTTATEPVTPVQKTSEREKELVAPIES